MFTGLVASTGTVRSVEREDRGARLEVEAPLAAELQPGDSVATSGVCLTAVEAGDGRFRCDVMAETLSRSSLGGLGPGDRVNLELPLRPFDRLGGHFVQGHVDGVGTVASVQQEGLARRLSIAAESGVCRYVADQGSVAVDGVSLTAIDATDEGFAVALIPETVERTTLGALDPGDRVNLEVDVLAKYVERLTGRAEPASGEAATVEPPTGEPSTTEPATLEARS
ncbi:MAG TPA: riboflavin synthase [Thermoleophilaceae bacterium]|nr:riboflavin synthase [Thermoleophilaceae bacterium]